MRELNKKIYIIVFVVIITAPLLLMPFFAKRNVSDLLLFDKRNPTSLSDIFVENADKTNVMTRWFTDRLPFKQDIISGWALFLKSVNVSINPKVVILGKDNWLFIGNDYNKTVEKHRGLYKLNNDVDKLSEKIITLKEYCNEAGIGFLFVMPPEKATVYPEYLPDWYTTKNGKPYYNKLARKMAENLDSSIFLDLTETLIMSKKTYGDDLFTRTDTHWSALGAYQGYSKTMESFINVDNSLEKVEFFGYSVKFHDSYDLKLLLGIKKVLEDFSTELYVEPSNPYSTTYMDGTEFWMSLIHFENEMALNDKSILIIRDSSIEGEIPFLANTFTDVYSVHYDHIFNGNHSIDELVQSLQPDILLLQAAERQFEYMLEKLPKENFKEKEDFLEMPAGYVLKAGDIIKVLDIDGINSENDGIHFQSTGKDPYFTIGGFEGGKTSYMIMLDITVPGLTVLDVFYCSANQNFSAGKMERMDVLPGRNTIYIPIDYQNSIDSIRIDPGGLPGGYIIHSLEIRSNKN